LCRYGNYSAYAVRRILKQRFPLISLDGPTAPESSGRIVQEEIEDVETGSFDDYDHYTGQGGESGCEESTAGGGEESR
jgi:hypothetical protein